MRAVLGSSYRDRVALEWRAALGVGVCALVVAVLARVPGLGGPRWWVLGYSVIVVVVTLGLAVRNAIGPMALPVTPPAYTEQDLQAAAARVRRGERVSPTALQDAATGRARQALRSAHLNFGWWPVLGATWSLRIGTGGLVDVIGYVIVAFALLAGVGLLWCGRMHHRLDDLEDTAAAAPGDPAPVPPGAPPP